MPRPIFRIFLSLAILSWAASGAAAAPDLSRPLPGRLRAGYMNASKSNMDLLPKMASVGMNAALPKIDIVAPLPPDSVNVLRSWAERCGRYNLAFLPVLNWWTAEHRRYLPRFDRVVTDGGKVLGKAPCPYTADFWETWIVPRLLGTLQVIGRRPLAGLLVDLEMYEAEYSSYDRGCYCDRCYSRYMEAKGLQAALPPPADRANKIKNAGDLKFYESLQQEAVRRHAANCRTRIHNIRPGLRLGALQLDISLPFQKGVALGWGTPQLPVLCLTENTYAKGHSTYIASAQKSFRELGAHADLLVGIWQSKFPPENMAEQLFFCARDSYGFWIYTLETFANPDYHPLPGGSDAYWTAIRRATQELDQFGSNPSYQTPLTIRSFEPPPTPLPWSEFVKYGPVAEQRVNRPESLPVAHLRGTNWLYFYAEKGDEIRFEVRWRRVASFTDPVRVGLISPDGKPLSSGTAKMGRSFPVWAAAPISGVYGLVVMSEDGRNAADIEAASHAFAVRMAPPRGAWFVDRLPPVFASVVPDTDAVEFEFLTEGGSEAVLGTVLTMDGVKLWSGMIDGPTKVYIERPASPLLQLRFDKVAGRVFEDVGIKALRGVFPFLSTIPSGLHIFRDPAMRNTW